MDDGPTTPQASGEGASPLRRSVAAAAERMAEVIETAEKAAAEIIEDAEAQAQAQVEESRRIAAERGRLVAELTGDLVRQAEAVKRQADELTAALEAAQRRLESEAGATAGPRSEAEPTAGPRSEGEATAGPQSEPPAPPHLRPLPSGAGGAGGSSTGARLLATQMAAAGAGHEEIEARMREEFGVEDASAMLDEILGPDR